MAGFYSATRQHNAAAHWPTFAPACALERHRLAGTGPSFHKCGPGKRAKVLYAQGALTAWLAKFEFNSTSQYER